MKQPRLWRSFGHAMNGVRVMVRTQRNARIHLLVASLVLIAGCWLALDLLRWSVLILTIAAVLSAEAFNTAVEAVVDLLSPEYHVQAKVAKDVAAGAVLLLAMAAVLVGLCILGPPLWERWQSLSPR